MKARGVALAADVLPRIVDEVEECAAYAGRRQGRLGCCRSRKIKAAAYFFDSLKS
jgi:hypothetical protein